jgi:hypothetical protein
LASKQAKSSILLILIPLLFLFQGVELAGQAVVEDSLYNKVMCGYQGWFSAAGDDPGNFTFWKHWCKSDSEPTPETITIDAWPDYSEYPPELLFYPSGYDWYYPDGTKAGFFSSNLRQMIMIHCRWMRDYGIDGVFLQRFSTTFGHPLDGVRMNNVLKYMLEGAEQNGLKVVVMYDVTGTPLRDIGNLVKEDWAYLVDTLRIHRYSCYQYHPDRNGQRLPVVAVWGFGFLGTGTRNQASIVIDFFKNNQNPQYRATLMGGVPGYWRFGNRDSKAEYEHVYAGFDIVSPWTVGRFGNEEGIAAWQTEIMADDIQLTAGRGQEYLPVCFPGFSNSNLRRNWPELLNIPPGRGKKSAASDPYLAGTLQGELNEIPRNGGRFMWSQFYHWTRLGNRMLYVAMFDEVDEGTSIFKVAPDSSRVPGGAPFLHLGIDGFELKSDFYLWLTGSAGFIIKQGLPFPKTQPQRLSDDSFEVKRRKEKTTRSPETEYVRITVKQINREAAHLAVYRKTGNNDFHRLAVINEEDIRNGAYTLIDKRVNKRSDYTYILVVFDAAGFPVALSNMIRI